MQQIIYYVRLLTYLNFQLSTTDDLHWLKSFHIFLSRIIVSIHLKLCRNDLWMFLMVRSLLCYQFHHPLSHQDRNFICHKAQARKLNIKTCRSYSTILEKVTNVIYKIWCYIWPRNSLQHIPRFPLNNEHKLFIFCQIFHS